MLSVAMASPMWYVSMLVFIELCMLTWFVVQTGRLLNVETDTWVHVNCARTAQGVVCVDGALSGVLTAVIHARATSCSTCGRVGAAVRVCVFDTDMLVQLWYCFVQIVCAYAGCGSRVHLHCSKGIDGDERFFCVFHGCASLEDRPSAAWTTTHK